MSEVAPDIAAIDAAIAKGEWWLRVLQELAEAGVALAGALAGELEAGRRDALDAAEDYVRISAAVRQAVAMSVRLEEALRGLTALRTCTLEEIAAAKAAADEAARQKARARAKARREARKEQVRQRVMEVIDREAVDAEDHENLTIALEERLSFDPAYTDIDSLPLRETVMRICADLRITPDWSRWEAEDWNPPEAIRRRPWPPPRQEGPPEDLTPKKDAAIRPPAHVRLE